MNPVAPTTLTQLEQAIWRTVAYVDLFDYPLTAVEIHRYLDGVMATRAEIEATLTNGDLLGQYLGRTGIYFHLPGRQEIIAIRRQREAHSLELWPDARRYGRLFAQLPFVRMVAVTGSLAMNNVGDEADIDYFIVTENGRLWLTRALVIAVVRWAARKGVCLCPNYFVAETALALPERTLYTARELAQMAPLFGRSVYQRLRQLNSWTGQFLPNAAGPPPLAPEWGHSPSQLQTLAELPLRGRVGERLERWEQTRKIRKLGCEQNESPESNFSATICKGHVDAHQQRTLAAFYQRLAQDHPSATPTSQS